MVCAIIVAAGTSRRMGFDKMLSPIGEKPVVAWSIERFERCPLIDKVIVVIHPDRRGEFEKLMDKFGFNKVASLVDGGSERHLSVWNGIHGLPEGCTHVAVHDAARPLVSPELIGECIQIAMECGAVSLAAPVVETLKRADAEQKVTGSVDRTELWAMQTPQVFRTDWLLEAYKRIVDSGQTVTDEVSALQYAGYPVRLLRNADWNIKITFPSDLQLAEKLIELKQV